MKRTLTDFFDNCTAEELDTLLGEEWKEELPSDVDSRQIYQKALSKAGLKPVSNMPERKLWRQNKSFKRWLGIAACLILALLVLGTSAFVVEAREYQAAVQFFQDYGLSSEGLTREEVKAVYRDITTETFSYAVTAEVIQRSIPKKISGVEISQEQSTPKDVKALWELALSKEETGIYYLTRSEMELDEDLGFEVLKESYLEKYEEKELLWSASFSEFELENYMPVTDGVLVWGSTPTHASYQPSYAWLAKTDDDGNILWERKLPHDFKDEYIAEVLENDDGSYAVFSRGDLNYLVVSQYSVDGKELNSQKTQVGNRGIWNAARLGEDYIVQLGNQMSGETSHIVKVSRDGIVSDTFTYTAKDCHYYLTDMAEFGGKLYLSAYSVPKLPDESEDAGGRDEIAAILNYIFDNDLMEITSEELTPLLRDHYTAVLLVCDPKEGTPQTFYSVPGCLGGGLSVEGEELLWNVESFSSSLFSLATSAFSIAGNCEVFRYSFSQSGELLRQEKTDEVTNYYR